MKTAKLVLGIISIVLSLFVMFQSCAAGIGDAMMGEGGTSGSAGTIVAFLIMCGDCSAQKQGRRNRCNDSIRAGVANRNHDARHFYRFDCLGLDGLHHRGD